MIIPLLGLAADFMYLILFIAGANSFPRPLNAADERKYLLLLKEGDKDARGILIEKNLRLVAHIIKKYYSTYREQDDLISIGTIGLIKAIDSFNVEKGTRLATYAARCIENAIRSLRLKISEILKIKLLFRENGPCLNTLTKICVYCLVIYQALRGLLLYLCTTFPCHSHKRLPKPKNLKISCLIK